jgi:hypothetical protein
VEIRTERFDDSSLPDGDGMYEYRYVGTTFHVTEDTRALILRVYDEEPDLATLVAPTFWTLNELRDGLLGTALRMLRDSSGIRRVRLYNRMTGTYLDERVI